MAEITGVITEDTEAQSEEQTETPAPEVVTQPDELTTLKSRNAGLDAKVTTLTAKEKAEKARADAAEAKLAEYVGGKAVEDEDTRALIQRLNSENEQAKAAAKVAGLAAKYPETYANYGEAVQYMTEEALAAGEARLLGIPAESNRPPTPVGNNAARPATGTKTIEEMTLAELKAHMKVQFGNLSGEDLTRIE